MIGDSITTQNDLAEIGVLLEPVDSYNSELEGARLAVEYLGCFWTKFLNHVLNQ